MRLVKNGHISRATQTAWWWRRYAAMQKGVTAWCLAAALGVLLANRPAASWSGSTAVVLAAWLLLGAGLQPLVPLTLEHAAEMTFPLSADVSSVLLQVGSNVAAAVQTYALGPLLSSPPSSDCSSVLTPAAGFVVANMLLALALTIAIRPRLSRSGAAVQQLLAA